MKNAFFKEILALVEIFIADLLKSLLIITFGFVFRTIIKAERAFKLMNALLHKPN